MRKEHLSLSEPTPPWVIFFFPAQFNVHEFPDPVTEVLYSCLNTWKRHSDVTLLHHLDSKH